MEKLAEMRRYELKSLQLRRDELRYRGEARVLKHRYTVELAHFKKQQVRFEALKRRLTEFSGTGRELFSTLEVSAADCRRSAQEVAGSFSQLERLSLAQEGGQGKAREARQRLEILKERGSALVRQQELQKELGELEDAGESASARLARGVTEESQDVCEGETGRDLAPKNDGLLIQQPPREQGCEGEPGALLQEPREFFEADLHDTTSNSTGVRIEFHGANGRRYELEVESILGGLSVVIWSYGHSHEDWRKGSVDRSHLEQALRTRGIPVNHVKLIQLRQRRDR